MPATMLVRIATDIMYLWRLAGLDDGVRSSTECSSNVDGNDEASSSTTAAVCSSVRRHSNLCFVDWMKTLQIDLHVTILTSDGDGRKEKMRG